jgi:hypothetical protein
MLLRQSQPGRIEGENVITIIGKDATIESIANATPFLRGTCRAGKLIRDILRLESPSIWRNAINSAINFPEKWRKAINFGAPAPQLQAKILQGKPPRLSDGTFLMNHFLKNVFPNGGLLFSGSLTKFPERRGVHWKTRLEDYMDANIAEFSDYPYINIYRSMVEVDTIQATKAFKRKPPLLSRRCRRETQE